MGDYVIKNALEELDTLDDDWDDPDYMPPTEAERAFAADVYELLMSLVNNDNNLTEEFTSSGGLKAHFEKHCLAKSTEKVSTRTSVYYDFKDKSQYKELEKNLINAANKPNTMSVSSLLNSEEVNKFFRKLFEGGQYMYFGTFCELHNDHGNVGLLLHSFASDYTKNYRLGNTIDVLVRSSGNKTITLYPVDAHYLETKMNNIIKNYSDLDIELKFNND